jgi:ATP-dependent Clp protease ATP-binding subunit ClpA
MAVAANSRRRPNPNPPPVDLAEALRTRLIGQGQAIATIVPYIHMFQSGLGPEGRPQGVFMLLGPTGTGKTKTVEALADVLHGNEKLMVKIDCGEFQLEHEVAKLIGAPPGYLGHRETVPAITQQKLNNATSEKCSLSLVLFDEIEKAAPSMSRLLLGVLDKAQLRLGDNTSINFENTLIFMTSNLGGKDMLRALHPEFGFDSLVPLTRKPKVGQIAINAAKKQFTPEFINRVDALITYDPLSRESLWKILNQHLDALQTTIESRLLHRSFEISVSRESRLFLLRKGTSLEFGARELKRTLQRNLVQVLGAMIVGGEIDPGCEVKVDVRPDGEGLVLTVQ